MSADTQSNGMTDDKQQIRLDADGAVRLPVVELLTGRGFITGKSGSGKSNSASVVVEELLDQSFPVLIVDTDGEYWGLKEEYEILHVGADEECDLQVGPEHAEKLAELALEKNVPIILDVSGYLDTEEADALVRETARELFTREKRLNKPFLMLVEEVHEYIPEGGGMDETGEMLVRIGKRGRKRGLGLVGISQRPADVKKDFITQCDWLLWHRLTWENDTQVVRRVVDKATADAVSELGDGEAFLMADFLDSDIQRVQVRRKRTFDAGATPDLGEFERPDLKNVGSDLVGDLEEISQREERRQDRIAELEARVESLQEENQELEEELDNAQDMRNLAQNMAEGFQAVGGDGNVASEKVDELVEERNQLRSSLEERDERIDELEARVEELAEYEQRVEQLEGLNLDEAEEALTRLAGALDMDVDGDAEKWRRKFQQEREKRKNTERKRSVDTETNPLENRLVSRFVSGMKERINDLSKTKKAMLRYYISHGPAEASDAYKYAGNSPTSSRRVQYSNELVDAGLLSKKQGETYEYALSDTIRDELGEHFDEAELRVVEDHLEDHVDDAVMEMKTA